MRLQRRERGHGRGVRRLPGQVASASHHTTSGDYVRGDELLVFCTYASAPTLAASLPQGYTFDFGIFDEAHKTAGEAGRRNSFAGLDHPTLSIRKRLFMNATPLAIDRGIICDFRVIISVESTTTCCPKRLTMKGAATLCMPRSCCVR